MRACVQSARCGLIVLAMLMSFGPAAATPVINEIAPQLIGQTLAGETINIERLRGKVVLVTYWATWCQPCRREMPVLDSFYKAYRERGVEVISVSVDFARDLHKVWETAQTLSYPVLHAKALSADGFGVSNGVPVTFLIDRNGIVRERFVALREGALTDAVLPLLQQATPAETHK